jgi:hypothetical protein
MLAGYLVVWYEEDQARYDAAISDRGIKDLIEFGLLCARGEDILRNERVLLRREKTDGKN